MKTICYHLMVLLCFAFVSCVGDSGPIGEPVNPTPVTPNVTVPVAGVTVDKPNVNMKEGQCVDITATVSPDNASNKNVTWKSDDPAVATVSNGKITAVGSGNTIITVTTSDGNKTAAVGVQVSIDMLARQRASLLALFNATDGPNWKHNDGWNSDVPLRDWYGVSMTGDNVEKIDLSDNNLKGELPDGLQALFFLEQLILKNNHLSGAIPASLGALASASNAEGDEPMLKYLTLLDLSGNDFTGDIPETIGNLVSLQTLKLDNNKLTGNLPVNIANLAKLSTLTIVHNKLEGTIPEEIIMSSMWKKIVTKIDLTQDNGKQLDDGRTKVINVTNLILDNTSLDMNIGDEERLIATIDPTDATYKTVEWRSDDENVATVDEKGNVVAVSNGITTITVKTKNGDIKATCSIVVNKPDYYELLKDLYFSKTFNQIDVYKRLYDNVYIHIPIKHAFSNFEKDCYPSFYDNWGIRAVGICVFNKDGYIVNNIEQLFRDGEAELAISVPRGDNIDKYVYVGGSTHGFENIISDSSGRTLFIYVDNDIVKEDEICSLRPISSFKMKQESLLYQSYSDIDAWARVTKLWHITADDIIIKSEMEALRSLYVNQYKAGMFCVFRHGNGNNKYKYLTNKAVKGNNPNVVYSLEDGWIEKKENNDLRRIDNDCKTITLWGEKGISFSVRIGSDSDLLPNGGMNVGTNNSSYNKVYYSPGEKFTPKVGDRIVATQYWSFESNGFVEK